MFAGESKSKFLLFFFPALSSHFGSSGTMRMKKSGRRTAAKERGHGSRKNKGKKKPKNKGKAKPYVPPVRKQGKNGSLLVQSSSPLFDYFRGKK